ncbi:cation transporting ATPase C-terminal domain-containing protein [Nonomuraea fuscirosea]|uniref:cation transporting ATPase C-terminal domain-containing protein n=1 Tax=Nonomuraea fuscirosea TaxID=1291556 RepID=UPI0011B263B3|nr:cation transporting ATPase C-terminal domain-containing protein [Nonomuraea fuscirosea]
MQDPEDGARPRRVVRRLLNRRSGRSRAVDACDHEIGHGNPLLPTCSPDAPPANSRFELVFTAALIYVPVLQDLFGTAALPIDVLAIIAVFPFIVWGTDELRRWAVRRHAAPPPAT